jgi:hypothetical protein
MMHDDTNRVTIISKKCSCSSFLLIFSQTLTLFVYRDSQEIEISVQPMDLVTRLREARDEENRMLEAIERLKDDMQF